MFWFVFYTPWGWAALFGNQQKVSATVLPIPSPLNKFLYKLDKTGYNPQFISFVPIHNHSIPIVDKFRAYFRGEVIDDWNVEIDFTRFPAFSREVLKYVASIPYGQTRTYSEVAQAAGNINAARAVGRIMSTNPLPLIIPCHRVIAKNGLGGFSSPGGIKMKQKMLLMEFYNKRKKLPNNVLLPQ
ncbi:MAG: MGMT family protein [Syntrophomonadaceae bacterium]|nr:MGMT family protein [Syntrophomonadaceae bacterium]